MMLNCPHCQDRLYLRFYPKYDETLAITCPKCGQTWTQPVRGDLYSEADRKPYDAEKAMACLQKKVEADQHEEEDTIFEQMMPDIVGVDHEYAWEFCTTRIFQKGTNYDNRSIHDEARDITKR